MTFTLPRCYTVAVATRTALWFAGRVYTFVSNRTDALIRRNALSVVAASARRPTDCTVACRLISHAADALVVRRAGPVHAGGVAYGVAFEGVAGVGRVAGAALAPVGRNAAPVDADGAADGCAGAVLRDIAGVTLAHAGRHAVAVLAARADGLHALVVDEHQRRLTLARVYVDALAVLTAHAAYRQTLIEVHVVFVVVAANSLLQPFLEFTHVKLST